MSVIIPLYNKSSTIARTLHSVFAQSFESFDLIVVDDGSSDDGAAVALANPDPRLRVIRQLNAGPGAARNRGVHEGRGSLLAFIDADDEWHPLYLERMVGEFRNDKALACATCGYIEQPSGRDMGRYWASRGLNEGELELRGLDHALGMLGFMQTLTTMVRRSAFEEFGGFYAKGPCLYAEDTQLFLKLLLATRIRIVGEALATYHREDSDLSGARLRARPVEPFLTDPQDVAKVCPDEMQPLLRAILRARAHKTACMLGYWGDWQGARELRRRFRGGWRTPYALPALVASTRAGAFAGWAVRALRSVTSSA